MFTMMWKPPAKLQKSDKKFFCRSIVVVDTNKNKILTLEYNYKMLTNGSITLFVGVSYAPILVQKSDMGVRVEI